MTSGLTGTVRQCIQSAVTTLEGIDTAQLDAELLLGDVLGVSRTHIMMYPEQALTPEQQQSFFEYVQRRAVGEPLAYITGKQGFWTLELTVSPAVLVPRPETELLVETALQLFPANQSCRVLDLGTGSGAIALSVASERKSWQVTATDFSTTALACAKANAVNNDLAESITLLSGSWFDAIPQGSKFDLIISNPPYLADDDPHLQQGALPFEPATALVAEGAGLADIKKISAQAPYYLTPGGYLLVEHGAEQGAGVRALFSQAGLTDIRTLKDLAGLDRVTLGTFHDVMTDSRFGAADTTLVTGCNER